MQPVVEVYDPHGFTLWPIAEVEGFGYLALGAGLTPAEVGTAVMSIASSNDIDPEEDGRPPRPTDPLGSFLHGLLTFETLFAAGGMRVTDDITGVTFLPGCCTGLEDRNDWHDVLDGTGRAGFGHSPGSLAERRGDTIRLTIDADRDDSPTIDLPADELRRLLSRAERDLTDFLALATDWLARTLPAYADPVTAALARALVLGQDASEA